jgi:hypothetical protein
MSYFNDKYRYLPEPTIIEENLTAEEAQNKEAYYAAYFKDKGYTILNIMKTGSLGSAIIKWDENSCFEEAKKYTSLKELYTNNMSVYRKAKEKGWLSEYTWLKRRSSKTLITEDIPNSEE